MKHANCLERAFVLHLIYKEGDRMDGISSYIANLSMGMSAAKLQTSIDTAVLKKAMDGGASEVEQLIEAMDQSVPNFGGSIDLHI